MSDPFANKTLEELQEELRRVQAGQPPRFVKSDMFSQGGYQEAPGTSGVGFFDRAALSFATGDEGKANILRKRGYEPAQMRDGTQGVLTKAPGGRQVIRPIDELGLGLGDLADLTAEVPKVGAAVGAGIATGGMGLIPAVLAQLGAGGLASWRTQAYGQELGSGQPPSLMQAGLEGGLNAVGEGVGRLATRAVGGPFARQMLDPGRKTMLGRLGQAAGAEDIAPGMRDATNIVGQMRGWDTKFNTNLEAMAPIDVTTGSPVLGNFVQRVRESPGGRALFREQADVPFGRELDAAFEAMRRESGAAGPSGTVGPYAKRAATGTGTQPAEEIAGEQLRQAAVGAKTQRLGERGALYDQFRGMIDPTATPSLTNTQKAIQEIQASDIFRRQGTGSGGVAQLRTALEEAGQIQTFDDLVRHRGAVADEVAQFDPTRMARGADGLMKKLQAALRADEEAFLTSGGTRAGGAEVVGMQPVVDVAGAPGAAVAGTKARDYARALFAIDESGAAHRAFGNVERLGGIPTQLRTMTAAEIRGIKRASGALGAEGGVPSTAEGRKAWEGVVAEVLDDAKGAAMAEGSRPEFPQLSGTRLQTWIKKWDTNPGSLEEVFGPETATDLRNFAQMLRDASTSERDFANWSKSGQAITFMQDMADLFRHPTAAAARIVGRPLGEMGAAHVLTSQAGKRYLQGQLPFQQNQTLLEIIGRLGGQAGARYGASELAPQR